MNTTESPAVLGEHPTEWRFCRWLVAHRAQLRSCWKRGDFVIEPDLRASELNVHFKTHCATIYSTFCTKLRVSLIRVSALKNSYKTAMISVFYTCYQPTESAHGILEVMSRPSKEDESSCFSNHDTKLKEYNRPF